MKVELIFETKSKKGTESLILIFLPTLEKLWSPQKTIKLLDLILAPI